MIRMTSSLSLIVCALFLPWTFEFPLDDQDIDQESKLLAELQNTKRRAILLSDEEQEADSGLRERIEKDLLTEDGSDSNQMNSVNSLDQNDKALVRELMISKRKKGKCVVNCKCTWWC